MKKLLALSLSLMLLLSIVPAFAQELQSAEITVESIDGAPIAFEDLGFSLTIPEILAQTEVSEEEAAAGAFDCYAVADGSAYFYMIAQQIEGEGALENYITTVQSTETVTDPGMLVINGITWFVYTLAETNQQIFSTDVNGTVLLSVLCQPADDAGFMTAMTQVLGTLKALEAAPAA
ncbi:MAG: hypothetical protein RSA65_09290 [Clostridia bacterium]